MAIINQTKTTSTMANAQKVSIGETWGSITTTWASETRTWQQVSQLITNGARILSSMINITKPS